MPSFLLNEPLLAQRDRADCLPACNEMVLAYQGRSVDPSWLRRVLESKSIGTAGFKVLNRKKHTSQRIPRNEFLLAWSDFDNLYALISPRR